MFRQIALLWVLVIPILAGREDVADGKEQYVLTERITVGRPVAFRFDVEKSPSRSFDDRLRIYREKELVYGNHDGPHGYFELISPNELFEGVAQDIDGDGHGEVIARYYTGGVNCCWGYLVFSIADGFKLLLDLEPNKYNLLLTDLDGDGAAECGLQDLTFHYWHSGNPSPFPRVLFRFKDGKLVVATDLMKAHPLVDEKSGHKRLLAAFEKSQRERFEVGQVPWAPLSWETWDVLLDFIYSGQAATGWRLFEEAWPDENPGFEAFKQEFEKQLEKSPYYDEIMAMQDNS
jgi:hypothetical protein